MLDDSWYNISVETFGNGALCISASAVVIYPYTGYVGKAPPIRWTSRPAERLDSDGKPSEGRFAMNENNVKENDVRDNIVNALLKRGWQTISEYGVGESPSAGRVDIKAKKDYGPTGGRVDALFIEVKTGTAIRDVVGGIGQLLWYRHVNWYDDYSRLQLVLCVPVELAHNIDLLRLCEDLGVRLWGYSREGNRIHDMGLSRAGKQKGRDVWKRASKRWAQGDTRSRAS